MNATYAYHATDLRVEVGRIVDDIEVRVPDPGLGSTIVEHASQVEILAATAMVLFRYKKVAK